MTRKDALGAQGENLSLGLSGKCRAISNLNHIHSMGVRATTNLFY